MATKVLPACCRWQGLAARFFCFFFLLLAVTVCSGFSCQKHYHQAGKQLSLHQPRNTGSFYFSPNQAHVHVHDFPFSSQSISASSFNNVGRKTALHMAKSKEDRSEDAQNGGPLGVSVLMAVTPFLSLILPVLLNAARNFPEGSSEQFLVIAALFASNRLYLYLLSSTILALAAFRGSQDDARLGQRVVDLTEELLYNPPLSSLDRSYKKSVSGFATAEEDNDNNNNSFESSAMIQSLSTELGDNLDGVSTETQAILLPLLVSALLASSVFILQIFGSPGDILASSDASSSGLDIGAVLTEYLPQLGKLWNILILSLFARCEVRRLFYELKLSSSSSSSSLEVIPWIFGLGITFLAYSGIWPAQNFVNMALAGLVARAIQITRFPAIVAALGLLTFYDAASVFLIKPAFAADMDTILASSNTMNVADATTASSAMGAVAMNKLASVDFQPGLLVTRVGRSLGGALGLGDAVFPAILAIFAKRYDDATTRPDKAISLFGASVGGYVLGCLACELLPFLSTSGVPALLLIAPSMLVSVLGVAASRGEIQELWEFDPNPETDATT